MMRYLEIFVLITTAVILSAIPSSGFPGLKLSETACIRHTDCAYREVCFENKCGDACTLRAHSLVQRQCARNAVCRQNGAHMTSCTCIRDHIGDPTIDGCFPWKNYAYIYRHDE